MFGNRGESEILYRFKNVYQRVQSNILTKRTQQAQPFQIPGAPVSVFQDRPPLLPGAGF